MGNEVLLSDVNFEKEVLQSDKPVLVDFWAAWCGPCMMLGPTVEEIANDFAGQVKVCKLNTDENEATSVKYQISAIPSLLFFKGGQVVDKSIGVVNKKAIAEKLNKLL
ncbi:MAG: thioredoxin [Elusimicrobia bacterium]|nr:thioredoxin [Elusimicrobiota bacterium]